MIPKADLEHNFSTSVIPCINLAITPACDELRNTITIQVIAVDGNGLVLRLKYKEHHVNITPSTFKEEGHK